MNDTTAKADPVRALPMETAPRDGTTLRLLVQFTDNATEDTDGPAWTIGSNSRDNTGDEEWQIAGWCWSHDHYTEGKGEPVGWLPMHDMPAALAQQAGAVGEHSERLREMLIEDYPEGVEDGAPSFGRERAALKAAILALECPQPPTVDDAMVRRAFDAFGAASMRDKALPQVSSAWMRDALVAALGQPAAPQPAIPEWFDDVLRCLQDVATEFRARGRDDRRFERLANRMLAKRSWEGA